MTQPADAELPRFFRTHPDLGKQDRQFIAETVFGILRRRIGFEFHTGAATPRRLLLAYLNRVQGMSLRQLEPLIGKDDAPWAAGLTARPDADAPLFVKAELPEWLDDDAYARHGGRRDAALGRALQQPAPLDLRVNCADGRSREVCMTSSRRRPRCATRRVIRRSAFASTAIPR